MRTALLVLAVVAVAACKPPGYDKGDDDSSDDDGDAAAIDAAGSDVDGAPADGSASDPDAPAGTDCTQQFVLTGYNGAGSVWLTGDFVAWATNPGAGAIELQIDGSGAWSVSHDFAAGDYMYKFIVDSTNWITDPNNPDQADDGFGGHNSVYRCSP